MQKKIIWRSLSIFTAAILLTGSLLFTGCDEEEKKQMEQFKQQESIGTKFLKSQENADKKPKPAEPDGPSTNGLGISDEKYEASIKKSLVSKNNNYLVKKVLEKMRAGEEVIISTLGGSVTEGAGPSSYTQGYAYQFKDMFIEKYAANKDMVKFVPAGIGGTPSPMGLIRYQKDVVNKGGRDPDLLIIEFAVNDWLECSKTRAMEYLVRNALEHNTAVIMLYGAATYNNQQAQIKPVADFYKLPQVSVSDGLRGSGINQQNGSKVYYTDMVHPTKNGHTFMARCILNLIDEIDASPIDEKAAIPEGYKNENPFIKFATIYGDTQDKNVSIKPGSFDHKDDAIQAYMHGGKSFPQNWSRSPSTSSGTANNEAFTMTLNCKSLIMIYKNANNNSFGKAEVFVDGQSKGTYAGHEEGGWNNCMVVMIIDEASSSQHTVEIKPAAGDEDKSFTILAFGYAQ